MVSMFKEIIIKRTDNRNLCALLVIVVHAEAPENTLGGFQYIKI